MKILHKILLISALYGFTACSSDCPCPESTDSDCGDTATETEYNTDTETDSDTETESATDSDTGTIETILQWTELPSQYIVQESSEACENYGDGWRLPTIDEQRSIIYGCEPTETDGSCEVTDGSDLNDWTESCNGCDYVDDYCYTEEDFDCGDMSTIKVYTSSSLFNDNEGFPRAFGVQYATGSIAMITDNETTSAYVLCVKEE